MSKQEFRQSTDPSKKTATQNIPQLQTRPFTSMVSTETDKPKTTVSDHQSATDLVSQTDFRFEALKLFADEVSAPPPAVTNHLVQPKLTVGAAGDKYEQEADQVAAQVVKTINSPASSMVAQREDEKIDSELSTNVKQSGLQSHTKQPQISDLRMKPLKIRRKSSRQSNLLLQMQNSLQQQVGSQGGNISGELESSIQRSRGRGQALAPSVREPMENAFGADFSNVKIHTDNNADVLSRSLNARAFATGPDLFFKQGEYNPSSQSGQELLAHELTHVLQQNGHTIQRNDDETAAPAKKGPSWINLAIEAAGHFLQGVLASLAGFGTITSVALAPAGLIAGLGGIGQLIIGVCKSIRAHLNRKDLTKDHQAFFNGLIAFEASISTALAVAGSISASAIVGLVTGIVNAIGGGIKLVRGTLGAVSEKFRGLKQVKAIMTIIESVCGFATNLAGAIASGTAALVHKVTAMLISAVKGGRGAAAEYEAVATSPDNDDVPYSNHYSEDGSYVPNYDGVQYVT